MFHHPSLAAVAAAVVAKETHTWSYVECIGHRPTEALQPHIWSSSGNTYHTPDPPKLALPHIDTAGLPGKEQLTLWLRLRTPDTPLDVELLVGILVESTFIAPPGVMPTGRRIALCISPKTEFHPRESCQGRLAFWFLSGCSC